MISIIVAMDKNGLIGKNGELPWNCPEDRKFFKDMTTDSVVIMGRKTFESIGKPLENRLNIVVTNKKIEGPAGENLVYANTFDHAIIYAQTFSTNVQPTNEVFVIGGSQIYKAALAYAMVIYINTIKGEYSGNVDFPLLNKELDEYLSQFELLESLDTSKVNYKMYGRNLFKV